MKQEEAADVELDDAAGESKVEPLIGACFWHYLLGYNIVYRNLSVLVLAESSTAEREPETVSEEHGDADEKPRSDSGASESDMEEEMQETSTDVEVSVTYVLFMTG